MDPQDLKKEMLRAQKNEITEYHIYNRLASRIREKSNQQVLMKISKEEMNHYLFWRNFTHSEVAPSSIMIFFYILMSRIFGLRFTLQLMERGEKFSQVAYDRLRDVDPNIINIIHEENVHEQELLTLLQDKTLKYSGSIILGLNDALVELTGALSGLTLALQDTKLIGMVGFITGIAASLSMAGSEYLSTKEEGSKNPIQAAFFTGLAYIITVVLLIVPYFIFTRPLQALFITLCTAILIIFVFTYYISVARNASLSKKFFEMLSISLGVAAVSFLIGYFIREIFHIDI